jgi:hypothetical protein
MGHGKHVIEGGRPAAETVQRAYDDADLSRAIAAYKFFYPTVSGAAIVKGNEQIGVVPNKVFGILDCAPEQLVFTANSDTPYGPLLLDLGVGPLVVELPPGPLIVCSMDINQRWVADMGLPGPDAGNGGKHLLLPPDYTGTVPDTGYCVHRASSNRQIIGARSLPVEGDVAAAKERLTTIKVYPLNPTDDWTEPQWLDVTGKVQDTTPLQWETNLVFWEVLHQTVDSEPAYEGYRTNYGELAALGIEKGKPFGPEPRMKSILEEAAQAAKPRRPPTRRCVRSPSPTDAPTGSSGTTGSGNGHRCASKTATSTPPTTSTSKRARSGSTKPSGHHPRCFAETRTPGRCTGLAYTTTRENISMAGPPTGSPCRCPCRQSCSGRSRSTTSTRGRKSRPSRARPRCARCSN